LILRTQLLREFGQQLAAHVRAIVPQRLALEMRTKVLIEDLLVTPHGTRLEAALAGDVRQIRLRAKIRDQYRALLFNRLGRAIVDRLYQRIAQGQNRLLGPVVAATPILRDDDARR
jgi:hypothetical protein